MSIDAAPARRSSSRRVRLSAAQIAALLEDFRSSGGSVAALARRHGVPYTTAHWHLDRAGLITRRPTRRTRLVALLSRTPTGTLISWDLLCDTVGADSRVVTQRSRLYQPLKHALLDLQEQGRCVGLAAVDRVGYRLVARQPEDPVFVKGAPPSTPARLAEQTAVYVADTSVTTKDVAARAGVSHWRALRHLRNEGVVRPGRRLPSGRHRCRHLIEHLAHAPDGSLLTWDELCQSLGITRLTRPARGRIDRVLAYAINQLAQRGRPVRLDTIHGVGFRLWEQTFDANMDVHEVAGRWGITLSEAFAWLYQARSGRPTEAPMQRRTT